MAPTPLHISVMCVTKQVRVCGKYENWVFRDYAAAVTARRVLYGLLGVLFVLAMLTDFLVVGFGWGEVFLLAAVAFAFFRSWRRDQEKRRTA
jgi:hypothetical protein